MSKLESTFNRLCNTRHGYLMIPVVGIGVTGFLILVLEILQRLIP
jgi:hypothetical protein